MNENRSLKLVVATFDTDGSAARALATLVPGVGATHITQAAIVARDDKGKVRFVETNDTTAGEGAWQGAGLGAFAGLMGILFTPVALLGMPIGAGIGALVGKLRDSGFNDDSLKALGQDLENGHSAVVAVIDTDDVDRAMRLLAEIEPANVVVNEVDADLATVLDQDIAKTVDEV